MKQMAHCCAMEPPQSSLFLTHFKDLHILMFQKVDADPGESIQQLYFCPQWLSDSFELNTFFLEEWLYKGFCIFFKIRNILMSIIDKLLDENRKEQSGKIQLINSH